MPEAGDLVGPYRLVSLLGKGAMGEVWRARDERLDRYVALKILPADAAGDVERRARMLREARAAAAIRHPNVVTLFDIVSHHGDDILVMELVEGRTLSETLRSDGAPSLELALRWIESVADALVAAHARGILHRDIKAANIMVSPDGIKVLDFGLAKLRESDPTGASSSGMRPAVSNTRIALDETMASRPAEPTGRPSSADIESYKTHVGSLIGTPLYMAPEQIAGELPDERSEVFSVGVLAYEILSGKPPYNATTMDALFGQIMADPPPELPKVPQAIVEIVERALAKERSARWATMAALRDVVAAERKRRFAPPARRWPLAVAAAVLLAGAAVGVYVWRAQQPEPPRPGDEYVTRALAEYDVFYNDRAQSFLRAALAAAPDHPRANAYVILFGGASEIDRTKAVEAATRARPGLAEGSKDRLLLDVAIALVEDGPAKARELLATTPRDRELAFWAAELAYQSGNYAVAHDEYKTLLASPDSELRGRIYDHYSSVLLYVDDPAEALRIGTLYRDAFPGEADAVAVYATTLAAAGKYPEALAAAEEALRLAEGEDTLAGLGKVLALSGDRKRAIDLYRRSLDRAGPARRPVRRAALGLLQWLDGDRAALATVTPCLAGGADADARERGPCLFVAGVIDATLADQAAMELDALAAAATPVRPAYGAPASLAKLVRASARFFGGACVLPPPPPDPRGLTDPTLPAVYTTPLDFYAAYHVPFFATWAVCERAALLAAHGDRAGAADLLRTVADRAPGRSWLVTTLERYR
ncbi:MAG: serine/threonine protein kinase [Deltaproteobacteria bacterium]|nr:serine/threonine protein kinase [Deltaproteobacteria bacterium]